LFGKIDIKWFKEKRVSLPATLAVWMCSCGGDLAGFIAEPVVTDNSREYHVSDEMKAFVRYSSHVRNPVMTYVDVEGVKTG